MSRGYRDEKDGADGGCWEEKGGADGGLLGAFATRMPYTNVSIAPRCCDITTAAPAKVGSEVVKEARKRDSTISEQ